jgi:hypothetical protein
VFRYFNVSMREEDFFSRCSVCNADDYIIVPASAVKTIKAALSNKEAAPVSAEIQLWGPSRFFPNVSI